MSRDTYTGRVNHQFVRIPNEQKRYWLRELECVDPDNDSDFRLSQKQEGYLAEQIQLGLAAQKGMIDNTNAQRVQEMIQAGKHAERILVEMNLDFARMMALASCGIVADSTRYRIVAAKRTEMSDDNTRKLMGPIARTGTYKPMTSMRSSYADIGQRHSDALFGLVEAAQKFRSLKPEDGQEPKFITFAAWRIQARIARGIAGFGRKDDSNLHIGGESMIYFPQQKRNEVSAYFQLHPTGDPPEGMPQKIEERILLLGHTALPNIVSTNTHQFGTDFPELSSQYSEENEDVAEVFSDLYGDEQNAIRTDQSVDNLNDQIVALLDHTLTEREAGIIMMRYGITDPVHRATDRQPMTFVEVGKAYGISGERARQLQSRSIEKLRAHIAQIGLEEFFDTVDCSTNSSAFNQDYGRRGSGAVRLGRLSACKAEVTTDDESRAIRPLTLREYRIEQEREAWQAFSDEKWDDPVRDSSHFNGAVDDVRLEKIWEILSESQTYNYQESFGRMVRTRFPANILRRITSACDGLWMTERQVDGLESQFRTHVMPNMVATAGEDFSEDRVLALFNAIRKQLTAQPSQQED